MVTIPTVDQVARPQAHGYDGTVDSILIRLGVTPETPIQDITAEAAPPKVDTSESAEDVRDETGRRYSRSNLSGGAGLDFLHSPNRSDDAALRYWDSKGVDVFGTDRGDVYDVRLMRDVKATNSTGATTLTGVAQIDGTVYYSCNGGIYEYGNATPKVVPSPYVGQLLAMGNSLYTLDATNGVYRYDVYVSWTPNVVTTTIYSRIWAVKSRILGVVGNILYDADSGLAVLTLPAVEHIKDVVDLGPAIVVLASTGEAHFLTLDDNLALIPAGTTQFVNEVPIMAADSFGTIGLVTKEVNAVSGEVTRFYVASLGVSGSYTFENMQLIYQVGDRDSTAGLAPHAIHATRDSIYVAIPEITGGDEFTLWRYYTPTGGYARAHSFTVDGSEDVIDFLEVDERMFIAVTGDDLYRESDDYVSQGYVVGPLADFYTADTKQWVGGELSGTTLVTGTSLELYETNNPALIQSPDDGDWVFITKLYPGDTKRTAILFAGVEARYHAAKVVWRSDSSRIYSPGFQSYSFRALPNPDLDILIRIPLNVSDQIDSPRKRSINVPGRGEAIETVLRTYEGKQVLIELYRPTLLIRGLIEKFESTIETISRRGAVRRILYCLIRGTRVVGDDSGYGATTTGANLGQGALGLKVIGTRETYEVTTP